ncbi:response regulator [Chitinophaga lutea]
MKPLRSIFIVDDDPIHQQITEIMLDRLQVAEHVSRFSDAQEVLEHIRGHMHDTDALPDVILLDLNMPVMDGWEFLEAFEKMREQLPRHVKVYVLTSSIDEKDREHVRSFSFVAGYLTKPLSKEVILQLGR